MAAVPLDGTIITAKTTNKKLVIKNNGNCTVRVYHWLATGDVFKKELRAGSSWSVYTNRGQMWRVINTNPDWNNLEYDEHYTVGRNSWQKWSINPTYCASETLNCNAELEHFSAVGETGCNKNDGKIITDPYIDRGLKLPYYVEYSFNGSTKKHGPYHENKDNYITGLASGVYKNLTVIDGNNCRKNNGDIIIEKATCPADQPTTDQPCNLEVDAGGDQKICAGNSIDLVAVASGGASCTGTRGTSTLSESKMIANWDMNNCKSFSGDNSNFDFSELNAVENILSCADVSVKGLYVTGNDAKHSCTNDASTGEAGDAVCVGMPNIDSFKNDHPQAVRFDITIDPSTGISGITKLQFSELAPKKYFWSATGYQARTGYNNYPTKYGIRVSKNGQEIYKKIDLSTTQSWSVEEFDFNNETAFITSSKAVYTFELLAYELVGNRAKVSAWDLDDIKVYGACGTATNTTNTATTYEWSNGSTDASIQATEAGTYSVTATDCNGCTATDEVVVSMDNSEIIVSANGLIDCANTSVILQTSGSSLATYKWSGPNGFNATEAAPSVSTTGTYELVAITTDGCEVEASVQVEGDDSGPSAAVLSGGPFEFCVGNGEADNITAGAIRTSGNAGAYTQWVVTDAEATTILGLPNSPSDVDFDGAGTGACLIWYLSHDGSLTGAAEGAPITDLQGCFSLSNSITVNRVECNESTLSISDVVVNEEEGIATLDICLDQPTTEFVYVRYTTSDDSAIKNRDYKGQASYAFIVEGEQCATVNFDIIDNEVEEEEEVFVVTLSTPYNAVIADGEGTVTILDTDAPVVIIPDPKLAIDDVAVFEDEQIAILTICSDAISALPITVAFSTLNETADAGSDYQEAAGIATIPAGMNCTEIELSIIDDREDESDEVFAIELSDPTNAILADAFGTVTILDNDEAIVVQPVELPSLTITDVTVNENEGYAHLQICLDQPAIQAVTVDCITADGTAIAGVDYLQTEDVAIIPVGQICTQASFKILDDFTAEETEVLFVNLSNASNAVIADEQGMITILDNDEIVVVECPEMNVYEEDGNIIISGLDAPVEIVQIMNSSFEVVFQCMNNCEATEIIENLPAGDYTVRINCYNNRWGLLCTEETKVTILEEIIPTAPLTCAGNITNGGRIAGEESFCGTYNPTVITSEIAAAGGAESRDIEYLWLASTVDCPSEVEDQIPGATGPTYDPGPITETTYFVRCSRRLGCTVWVESNCIVKDVFCPDGNLESAADSRNKIATSNTTLSTTKQMDKTYIQTGNKLIDEPTQATNFKQAKGTDINFYPNPVSDVLMVDLSALAGQAGQAYLSNQMGQVVKMLDLEVIDASPIQIQTNILSSGLYHLTIVVQGELVTTEKIMVQH